MGFAPRNPALDTHVYEVHSPDGRTEALDANVIAEAIYAKYDANWLQCVVQDAIMDYHNGTSMAVAPDYQVIAIDGRKIVKHSTRGCELCCKWKDSSTSWQRLSDLKESHPLQVAEFVFAAQIADEPAFNWWVSWVLKKRDWVVSLVKHQLDTTSGLISLGFNSPRLLRKPMPLIMSLVLPSSVI
jgi:hypothetical protein